MKKILIPTDFSKHAKHSIDYVLNFLQDTQIPCQLMLLNTYMVQQTDPGRVILENDELKRKSKLGLEEEGQEILRKIRNPNLSVVMVSHMGSLNNVIQQLLQKEKYDLIAMGKDGGKHVETVSTLLKQKQCPLLITYLS